MSYTASRVLMVVQESCWNRCHDFLSTHPQVLRIVQDGKLPESRQLWFEIELRDAAALPDFVANITTMPSFWKVCVNWC